MTTSTETSGTDLVTEALRTGTLAGLPEGHFINGGFVRPAHNRRMESYDPGRGEAFADFAAGELGKILRSSGRLGASEDRSRGRRGRWVD